MDYIAIPRSEFIKYFKIIEAKKGSIRSLKHEVTVKKSAKRRRKEKPPVDISSNDATESSDSG